MLRCHRKVLVVDAVRMVIGKLFQIRGAVELNTQPANTVLSVGWDSSWWSDDHSCGASRKFTFYVYVAVSSVSRV